MNAKSMSGGSMGGAMALAQNKLATAGRRVPGGSLAGRGQQ